MSIEKELRQNWDSVVYPETDVTAQVMPPGYQEGDVLLAQAKHPRTGRPMTGPTMSDITEPAMGLANMGAATLKGITQGFLGLPGELEALVYGAKEMLTRNADVGMFDAFINGLKKETILPTTEEVRKWLDTNVGTVQGGKGTYETIGETLAPGGQYKATKAIVKSLPKNLPVGMSTEAVGGMENVLKPAAKAVAPTSDIGFYSAVEQSALNLKRNAGSGQAMLNDLMKGENVKADEIKWIGLDDFLKDKKNVTKADVQNFIAQNKVDVQEVTLGGEFKAITDPQEAINYLAKEKGLTPDQLVDEYGYIDLNDYVNLANDVAQPAEPKFGAYTLPGGKNYREILLTMPAKEKTIEKQISAAKRKPVVFATSNGQFELLDEMGEPFAKYNTRAEAEQAAIDWAAPFTKTETVKDPEYHSSHWDQPNVLAHIRVNDRVDADGKKMLLVEEVQSDWHQAGRDKGYGPKTETTVEAYYLSDSGRRISLGYGRTQEEAAAAVDPGWKGLVDVKFDSQTKTVGEGVPDAPMKDTWYQLALKRVLKYAADNGYERVGLTTGSRQAERYDLSAQVDEIKIPMVADDGSRSVAIKPVDGGTIKLMVDSDGTVTGYGPSARQFTGKKIDEVIGKELADKVMKAEEDTSLAGLDLKVGGQGMKKYYDEVYPQFLAKYGKKWGAKVGETTIAAGRSQDASGIPSMYPNKEPVRYIDITPQMKESVGKGQPLFSATGIATGAGAGTMATSQQEPK